MSALINNGGQAFPCERDYGQKLESSDGMSLRDWFASNFSKGMLASGQCTKEYIRDLLCKDAFAHADAMIKERSV